MRHSTRLQASLWPRIALALVAVLCAVLLGEAGVRFSGRRDLDGQFWFQDRALRPYALPYQSLRADLAAYERATRPYAIPDLELGWTINSNASRENGKYESNSIGIRSDREFTIAGSSGVSRIALFGDSFVHGDEVSYDETWGHLLERELKSMNRKAEVMNFGVSGYGNDQAYLRWKLRGRVYRPDVVIVGFQAENCLRNLNVVRRLYHRRGAIPFSKPRFVMAQGQLRLVNFPTIDYRRVADEVQAFEASPLREYEYFYRPEQFAAGWIDSRLVEAVRELVDPSDDYTYVFQPGAPEGELCYRIIEQFVMEAGAESDVYVVHLPKKEDVMRRAEGRDFIYAPLLERLRERFALIDPTDQILMESAGDVLSVFTVHYSAKANAAIAASVAPLIASSPRLSRQEGPPAG